jgi:hypothetical protein
MTIRWKRGFFRAWVVFAVFWIAVAGLIQLSKPPVVGYFDDLVCEEAGKPLADVEKCVEAAHKREQFSANVDKLMWVFLPPVLILIVSVLILSVAWVVTTVVAWIIRGFRP